MKNLLKCSLILLSLIPIVSACDQLTLYHSYQSLSTKGWYKNDTVVFNIPILDSIPTKLKASVEVRSNAQYKYQDLYLIVSQNLQDSTIFKTDTIKLSFVDNKGRRITSGGEEFSISSCPICTTITKNKGIRTFKFVHHMKGWRLQGINDIGIRLER